MGFPWLSGFMPIINFFKNHQLSDTFVKASQLNEIQQFLGEALQLSLKLEQLNVKLELQNTIEIKEWSQYDKDLESLVNRLNVELQNNPYFAMSSISYTNYSQEISNKLKAKDYEAASDLRFEQIKLRDQILLNWVKYYLNIAEKLGFLDQKIGINETDTVKRYLDNLMQDLQNDD
ncbi:TPA: hypothetical protein ACGXMC_002292 [Bacillus cereus]